MATSVRESKILKEKWKEDAKSSSIPTKLVSSSFHRTGGMNIKIPTRVLPKTTFMKSLASRPRPPSTIAVKPNTKEPEAAASVEKSIPLETLPQKSTEKLEEPQKPKFNDLPQAKEETVLPHQKTAEKVSIPDTSLPPPNIFASNIVLGENNFQLPDITKLPPPIVNQLPLADHSSSPSPVLSDLPKETSHNLHSTSKTFLELAMDLFLQDKEDKEKTVSTQMSQSKIELFKFDINVNLIKSQLGR
jgi:hypothetical protein